MLNLNKFLFWIVIKNFWMSLFFEYILILNLNPVSLRRMKVCLFFVFSSKFSSLYLCGLLMRPLYNWGPTEFNNCYHKTQNTHYVYDVSWIRRLRLMQTCSTNIKVNSDEWVKYFSRAQTPPGFDLIKL